MRARRFFVRAFAKTPQSTRAFLVRSPRVSSPQGGVMTQRTVVALAASCALAAMMPIIGHAQKGGDQTHKHAAAQDAAVDFGVLQPTVNGALVPIGPPPCLQSGGIGGPGDPCAYKNHHLV